VSALQHTFLTLSVIFSSTGSSLDSDVCRNLLGCMSAAQNVRMSMAVKRVCLRDGTNTITGFFSACFRIAWYVGFAIAMMRDALCVMLNPCNANSFNILKYRRQPAKVYKQTFETAAAEASWQPSNRISRNNNQI